MSTRDWNEHYATGNTPWDSGEPDPHLVELVEEGELAPGRLLEIGCGTGTNALWLAGRGFEVTAVDVAPLAIETAGARRAESGAQVLFVLHDILAAPAPGGPYDLVFDRGVFHVFDEATDRALFAQRVAAALRVGGRWLSLAGSTEGPPRDGGPPRRSARDLAEAIEPSLALDALRATEFSDSPEASGAAWLVLARKREVPAQPSTRRDP